MIVSTVTSPESHSYSLSATGILIFRAYLTYRLSYANLISKISCKSLRLINDHITVATPAISASNSATSYEISGTSVTLTCSSTSDPSGSGTYEWKLGGQSQYVLSVLLA